MSASTREQDNPSAKHLTSARAARDAAVTQPTIAVTTNRMRAAIRQIPPALRAMRPFQWSKNGLVFMALIFAHRLFDFGAEVRVLLAFGVFSLAASSIYIVNDIGDREKDRLHPVKRHRPIAAGTLSLPAAYATAGVCAVGALALMLVLAIWGVPDLRAFFLSQGGSHVLFVATIVAYAGMNLAYTRWLKHLVLWDVFVIAAGFVLRAVAGALAIPVPISPWFYLFTTFLALFQALGKRRAELMLLEGGSASQRRVLEHYNLQLLDQLMGIVVTCALITYSLYTFQGDGVSHKLMITIPFVMFGMFRYLYLLYVRGEGEQPDEILWHDKQILASVTLFLITIVFLLYGMPIAQHWAGV